MPEVMFRRYLRAWWSAAWAPAWDLFGWLGVAVGGVLWLWNKRWPENYKWSAQSIGITPEAAMSDIVWVLPMVAGVLLLAYRFVRAPFEMHLVLARRIDQLTKQLK